MSILFPVLIFLWGVWISRAIFPNMPFALLTWTGFLWGSIAWTIGGGIFLVLGIPFYLHNMLIWCLIVSLIALVVHVRFPHKSYDLRFLLLVVFLFIVVLSISASIGLVAASYDSLAQLVIAHSLAVNNVSKDVLQSFGAWGMMLPMLHGAAFWFGDTVFVTIQTAFLFSLIGTFGYLCYESLKLIVEEHRTNYVITGLAVFLLGTNYFVLYQGFYIHNSILAAAYLFPAVILLWMAHVTDESHWLFPALILFLGFALTRTESVMYVAVFLYFALALSQFPRKKVWLAAMLPYVAVLLIWHIWLVVIVKPDTIILTTERIYVLIGTILATYLVPFLLPFLSRFNRSELWPLNLALGLMSVTLLASILLYPSHMVLSVFNSLANLLLNGSAWWGLIWIFCAVSLVWLHRVGKIKYDGIIVFGVVGFFLLTWLLALPRTPYRLGWGDSANRIFTHVLPIILFYIVLKVGYLGTFTWRKTRQGQVIR